MTETLTVTRLGIRGVLKHTRLVDAAHPRPLVRHTPTTQRDRPILTVVTKRDPVWVWRALAANDFVDLLVHQLGQDAEPDADAQRE